MKATTQKMGNFSPPDSKKRGKLKNFEYEAEPMVLVPTCPTESVAQYCIALPSTNKDKMLDEMDMLKNITEHLNEIVDTMEQVYAKSGVIKEEEEDEGEEPTAAKEDHEDMTSFLICCSQLSTQLDNALREEKQILESLLKWFEKEVHEMEELGEEEIIPDWQIPVADKNVTDNISKLLNRIQRLEELKGRVQELPKLIQLSTPKQEKRRPLGPMPPAPKDPKNIIEELAMKHATEDVMNMVQVFQDDTGQPQTLETMNNRMVEIMKVFERQTNKLHRVANEQDVLEGKLQKVQKEFQKIAEEKEIMEDELQKMKTSELDKMIPEARKKMLAKLDKGKVEEKSPAGTAEKSPLSQRRESLPLPSKQKENQKMKEDLAKAQANILSLEQEKKMLEEKLKKALEEAEMAKGQLAEIPPVIPDWQFPYTAIEEDDRDISKKGKKATKQKGKGEDLKQPSASGIDRTLSKMQRAETGKAGETFPGKGQELSAAPQTRDGKQKRKVSVYPEGLSEGYEKELPKQTSQAEIRVSDKKMDESKKTKAKTEGKSEAVDSKGKAKSKETAEIKKPRSKGTAKETPLELLDSTKEEEKSLPEASDKSPEEMLPPDTKRRKKEITISPEVIIEEEEEESLHISEEKAPPLISKMKVEDSAKPIKTRKPLMMRKEIPGIHTEPVELGEDETRELINERMLQLADHLTELEGMPEAETVAKLLLEQGQGMEELSDRQKLQLLNQLLIPDELQLVGETEEEQTEKKRELFANVAATLQLLQQTQAPEAGLSEEETNEMAEKRRDLLANLESTLQEAQAARPDQKDIDREINKLSEKRSLLLASLESNMKDLEQAQALAATQPSEMTENKVKELLQQRELLAANLEANLDELQRAKTLGTGLPETYMHEKEIDELSKQRQVLLASLKSNLKDLEEAEALAASQPGSVSDEKIKELREQRKLLTAHLESNLQDLQKYQSYVPGLGDEGRLQEIELSALSEKRNLLQEKLDSNLKDLQQAQEFASLQPGSINENILEELTKQRRRLTEDLTATVNDIQETQHRASQRHSIARPNERELYVLQGLFEKKQELLEKLESNQKELQEAQELAVAQPGSVSERKLQELLEQRRHLTADLESTLDNIQNVYRHASERTLFVRPAEREVYDLSEKKQELLEKLESNRKELQEAQILAVAHPGSVSDNKLKELIEQRRYLATDLEITVHELQKVQDIASEGVAGLQHPERELYELSAKKQELLEKLKSNQKELQEAQELAATDPGSISEHKLQELAEQNKCLRQELQETMHDILKAERRASERALIGRPAERELYELSVKKQVLQEKLESNRKELEAAQALAAAQPGSVSEHKLQELAEQRKLLSADLKATMNNIQKASKKTQLEPMEREFYEMSAKKQLIQACLESNWKALQEAQALAATQPDSVNEHKLQELAQERRRLTEDLKATVDNIQKAERCISEMAQIERPIDKELYELSEKKQLLLENLKGLQEAQALAATQPGTFGDLKRKQLAEQKRHLAAELEATVHDIQTKQRHASEIPVTIKPSERELYELSEKKYMLLEKLASNRKELQEAQALADAQPGSVSDYKLQELANQRRLLTEDLKATIHNIQEIQRHTLTGRSSEKQLHKLSEKEQRLLETLELKKKELQEAEVLAATQPGSISEHKLQELAEQKRRLTLDLEATVHDLQEIQHPGLQRALLRSPGERELYELSEKKQMLLKSLESKQKELEEAEALAATQPGSVSAHKLQELDKQRRRLAIDLEATVHGIQELQLRASQRAPTGRPAERDLYELSEKKQMLLRNLESKQEELEEAKALAAAEPGSIGENKLQELDEQRRRLALDLEATVHDIQELQHRASQRPLLGRPDERELSGLSEKKQILLESLESKKKELQEAEVLAATQPGSISEHKLQELAEQKRCLTLDLAATVHDLQEIQRRALLGSPGERELYDLSDKKQKLLESLESKNKELQEAEALAATQPGSVSAHKLQELDKQRRCLTVELEATVQEVQQRALSGRPAGKSLYELSEWKQVLLECLESNLKELEETHVLAAIQPDSISEKKIQELKEQRKILTENLKTVVQDVQKMKTHISESGGIIPFYRDLNELYKKKKRFLERLESNLKDLQAAEILAVAHPGSSNEQKVQELTEQRMLLAAGLDAIMQDLEDIVGLAKDKIGLRSRERNWEELSEKKKVFLENLASNLTALKQAQALAAAHQDDITEQKLQEIIEQRRLLTAGLQAIMQDMQQLQELVSSKLEKVEPSERELDELSEKRRLILENMEVNLEELKDLQAIVAQPSGMSEQKMQELTEKRELLVANFEAILQDMQDAQSFDLDQHVITRPDQRKINDLLELSRLESKLDDLEETGFFTDIQLDSLKRKVHKLKQQRRNLIDKWELLLLEDYPETYGLDKEKAKQKVAKKILDERKNLFSYLQSSIKDLQRKSIQPITSSDTVRGVSDDSLIMGSLGLLQLKVAALSAKYGPDDEKTAKRRALAAKLEANIRDLQAAFEVEKIEKPRYAATKDASQAQHIRKSSITELSDQQYLKPSFSGLQIQITKAPVIRKIKPDQTSAGHRKTEVEFDASVEEQQEKKLRREIEQVFKKHVLQQLPGSYYQQLPGSKTSSSMLPSALPYELNSDKIASDVAMQEILEYNKSLLPSHRANLQQALQLAQHQLQQQQQQQQQQSNALSERLRKMSVFFPQPPGTTRFHEYSTQPQRPAWEANQLPQKDYAQKLYLLKRKLLGPDMKGLGGAPFSSTQGPSSLAGQDQDTIVICGKGCNPFKKPGSFQAINEQLRHQ